LWRAGKHTSAKLAELFSVARSTVYRAVQRACLHFVGETRPRGCVAVIWSTSAQLGQGPDPFRC
jgi:hypothetical protein